MRIRRSRTRSQRHALDVEFCDRCGTVCDSLCRAERRLDEVKLQALQRRF